MRLGAMGRVRIPLWWRVGWVLLVVSVAVQWLAPPRLVEAWFARGVYPCVARALSGANRHFPFSLAEALLVGLAGGVLVGLAGVLQRPGRLLRRAACGGARLLAAAGYLALAFVGLWGLNYRRPPAAERLGLRAGGTVAELTAAARWLAGEAGRLAPPGDPREPTRLPYSHAEMVRRIEEGFAQADEARASVTGRLGPAKPVFFSGVLSQLGLSGVFSPFTGEPNYNRLLPDASLPPAVAHEKAHQRGVASEDEASFAGFIALWHSSDRYLRYCAALNGAAYLLRAVAHADPACQPSLARLLEGRPTADYRAIARFWAQYCGPAQRVAGRVNDLYLKANRVPSGVQSYDAVTDLLVAYHRDRVAPRGRP